MVTTSNNISLAGARVYVVTAENLYQEKGMKPLLKQPPITLLNNVEVWIEPRYCGANGSRGQILIARMVEWREAEDGEGLEPVFGRCMLSPNRVTEVEKAKSIVKRYVQFICRKITFMIRVGDTVTTDTVLVGIQKAEVGREAGVMRTGLFSSQR